MAMNEMVVYKADFKREVDKSEIPICNILGVKIAAINMEWLLQYLKQKVKSESGNLLAGDYICVSNVHTTVTSYEDSSYRRIQNDSLMALPDGGPLSSIGRRRGFKQMERVTGPSLMKKLFESSDLNGYRHYFYGSTEETLNMMQKKIIEKHPLIQIAGTYSPPFRPISDLEDDEIIKQINKVKPDFIWIGLGAPKQEEWMAKHKGKVNGLMIGVGAGFDYIAGNIKRAPEWMQKMNLEWFYRLIQEPRRLFKRYLLTNSKFLWLLVRGGNNIGE